MFSYSMGSNRIAFRPAPAPLQSLARPQASASAFASCSMWPWLLTGMLVTFFFQWIG